MSKLTAKELTIIRNVIIVVSMVGGLIVWFVLPAQVKNTGLIHVGNGEYGSKIGMLIVLLFPLFALIPNSTREDIHTEDPEERKIIEEDRCKAHRKVQIITAIVELLVICVLYFLWFAFAK